MFIGLFVSLVCIYVCCFCLFVSGFTPHSKTFNSHRDVTITSEWLQILIHTRHSWPLSSEVSLACRDYCDTGHPFIMVISDNPWHLHLLPSVLQSSCHCFFFLDLNLSRLGFEHSAFRLLGKRPNRLRNRGSYRKCKHTIGIIKSIQTNYILS